MSRTGIAIDNDRPGRLDENGVLNLSHSMDNLGFGIFQIEMAAKAGDQATATVIAEKIEEEFEKPKAAPAAL